MRKTDSDGYVIRYLNNKHGGRKNNTILEHRYIWEKYNGKINRGDVIHHKDGDRLNNNIYNLQCLSRSEHQKKHRKIQIPPMLGKHHSIQTREKMSIIQKNVPKSEITKQRMSIAKKGKNMPEKTKMKISKSMRGNKNAERT